MLRLERNRPMQSIYLWRQQSPRLFVIYLNEHALFFLDDIQHLLLVLLVDQLVDDVLIEAGHCDVL